LDPFLQSQSSKRTQYLYDIPTTPAQDQAALSYLNSQKDDIGKLDNCADRTYHALKAAGIPGSLFGSNGYGAFPDDIEKLMNRLTSMGGATAITIPQLSPNIPSFPSFNPRISMPSKQ
jgi:hypothetical protein